MAEEKNFVEWKRRRELANARTRKYRERKKREADLLKSMALKNLTTEEIKRIEEENKRRRKEQAKERSKRYRERKRSSAENALGNVVYGTEIFCPSDTSPPFEIKDEGTTFPVYQIEDIFPNTKFSATHHDSGNNEESPQLHEEIDIKTEIVTDDCETDAESKHIEISIKKEKSSRSSSPCSVMESNSECNNSEQSKNDSFSCFGQYVAAKLRSMSGSEALEMQTTIVNLLATGVTRK